VTTKLRLPLFLALGLLLLVALTSAVQPDSLLADLDREIAPSADFDSIIAKAYGVASPSQLKGIQVALIYPLEAEAAHVVHVFPARQVPFPAASTTKVLLAAAAAQDAVTRGWDTKLGGASLISITRNPSANKLLDAMGFAGVNSWLAGLGFSADEFHFARRFADFKAPGDNTCTALGLAKFYFLLAQTTDVQGLGTAASLAKVRALLDSEGDCNNKAAYNDRLNGKLPAVHFIHKTGSNNDVLADGGIFRGPQRDFILVVLDKTKNKAAMQRLGAAVYGLFNAQP
jgi:hypothetical protein